MVGDFFKGCLVMLVGFALLFTVILGIVMLASSGFSSSSNSSSGGTTPDDTGGALVFTSSGSDVKDTQTFTVSDTWDLAWAYDCSATGGQGSFMVSIYNADGTPNLDNGGVSQYDYSGKGVEHYQSGGTLSLEIITGCKWTVNVTE